MANKNATTRRTKKARRPTRPLRNRGRSNAGNTDGSLTSLSITGFRGIRELHIDGLKPLTVFTGDNGSGKSTCLEAAFALFARKNPRWVVNVQARRGLQVVGREGPSYLGLFYGRGDVGEATLSGRTTHGDELRLIIRRAPLGSQTPVIESAPTDPGGGVGIDVGNLPTVPNLQFLAHKNGTIENEAALQWTITPPDKFQLIAPGAQPMEGALFQHPGVGAPAEEDKGRYGDIREANLNELVVRVVRTVDPRVADIEYLQTTRAQYFRAELNDGTSTPLGALGGGVVNAFRAAVNLAYVRELLAIDEVENGIYHRRLPALFRGLVAARSEIGTQLVLATHSHEALTAIVSAAFELDPENFALVHLRRDEQDEVHATTVNCERAKSSIEHGYDLR